MKILLIGGEKEGAYVVVDHDIVLDRGRFQVENLPNDLDPPLTFGEKIPELIPYTTLDTYDVVALERCGRLVGYYGKEVSLSEDEGLKRYKMRILL